MKKFLNVLEKGSIVLKMVIQVFEILTNIFPTICRGQTWNIYTVLIIISFIVDIISVIIRQYVKRKAVNNDLRKNH